MWGWGRGCFFFGLRGDIEARGFFRVVLLGLGIVLARLLLLLLRLLIIVNRDDRIGAFDLVFHLIIAAGDVAGEGLRAADLARLVGGLGALDLSALGDVAGEWIDRRHPHLH